MPLWTPNLSESDLLASRGYLGFAYLRGMFWNASGGTLLESTPRPFHLAWRNLRTDQPNPLASGFGAIPVSATLYPGFALYKALSIRAGLVQALEPTVLALDVSPVDAATSVATVTLDKPGSISLFVKRLTGGVETGLIAAADGAAGGSAKVRTLQFPRQSGTYRVIVRAGMTRYARDYSGDSPISALTTYASSQDASIKDDYPKGVSDGRRAFAEAIYPLASPYGFDAAGVLAGAGWDTDATRQAMVQSVANSSSIAASKTFLNALVGQGAPPYNTSSPDPNYYTGLAVSYAQAVYQQGGVGAYKSVYNQYPAFTYNTSSQDGGYLDGLKGPFVAKIQQDADTAGYNRAYGEVYAAARDAEITGGVPEGQAAFSLATSPGQASGVSRHLYDAGFLKAAQEIYDLALSDGFDWRSRVNPSLSLGQTGVKAQYRDLKTDFKSAVQAVAKSDGLKVFLEAIRTQYAFSYDYNNSANRSNQDYTTYLISLRDGAIQTVYDTGRVGSYRDLYDAGAVFGFTYNPAQSAANLAALKDAFLTTVYSYGIVATLQELYDLAASTYFNTLTNYPSVRDPSFVQRTAYLNPKAATLRNLKGDYFTRVYESGVIYVYRERMYPLAEPYGFTFDRSQIVASYYSSKEPEFIEALRQGYGTAHIIPPVNWVYDAQRGGIVVNLRLNKPARAYLWLTQDGATISPVVVTGPAATTHEVVIPANPGLGNVVVEIEVSNG